jgi:hypothetical protein
MKELVAAFKENSITLSSFISSLEFLFHVLEEVEYEWEESFLDEITNLESVNSSVSSTIPKEEIENIITSSVANLEGLINKKLRV